MLSLVLAGLCAVLWYLPTGFESALPASGNTVYVPGRVIATDDTEVGQYGVIRQGIQQVTVRILEGRFEGDAVVAANTLMGDVEVDSFYVPGMKVLLALNLEDGKISWASVRWPYRIGAELMLFSLFAVLLVCVMGWTGVRALLSFLVAALAIWKVLVPLVLKGWDPVPVALGVVALLTGAITFLVGGVSRKGLVAFLGASMGVGFTCLLALLFAEPLHVNGAVRPFAKALLTRFPEYNYTRMFVAGVFIACSGAVMDLAMDIAAAVHEVKENRPDIGRWDLMRSGLRVGRAVIGTMTTTLLLAYSGGYLSLLMWFMVQGVPLPVLFNSHYVSAEIMNTLVGSFGLVTVAPFTAFVGAMVYGTRPPPPHGEAHANTDTCPDDGAD